MIKNRIFLHSLIFLCLALPVLSSAETLTLTTYYPSPLGIYDQLRLVPKAPMIGACQPGTFYVRNDNYSVELCQASSTWAGAGASYWTLNGTNLYPHNNSWNVGIGTSTPGEKLTVAGGNIRMDGGNRILTNGFDAGSMFWFRTAGAEPGSLFMGFNGTANGNANNVYINPGGTANQGLLVNSSGNVGIGVSAPLRRLHVVGGTTDNTQLRLEAATGQTSALELFEGGTSRGSIAANATSISMGNTNGAIIHIDQTSGNVGINEVAPAAALDVNGTVRIRGGSPLAGRYLQATDSDGSAVWTYVTYAP